MLSCLDEPYYLILVLMIPIQTEVMNAYEHSFRSPYRDTDKNFALKVITLFERIKQITHTWHIGFIGYKPVQEVIFFKEI